MIVAAELARGVRIARAAPWWPFLGTNAIATSLLAVGVLAARDSLGLLSAVLGVGACGGAAAYLLDDEAETVADATPSSRPRRFGWRLPLLAAPAVVVIAGLTALDQRDPSTHWLRLLPMAAGSVAIGVALAAVMRRRGMSTPGDLAGVLTTAIMPLLVVVNPLWRRWVTLTPLGDQPHLARTCAAWTAIVVLCAGVTFACMRDPGRAR